MRKTERERVNGMARSAYFIVIFPQAIKWIQLFCYCFTKEFSFLRSKRKEISIHTFPIILSSRTRYIVDLLLN